MSSRLRAFDTSVGTKILIGLSGLALILYLLAHIVGNLLIFFGPEVYNRYAHTLTGNPLILPIEIGLALVFLIHIYKTIRMSVASRKARPAAYVVKRYAGPPSRKSLASSTMIISGLWLLVFLVIHVRAFRFGLHYTTPEGVRDLYAVEMEILRSPLTVAFYVLTMGLVGAHLWHGFSSAFQSLGIDDARWTPHLLALGRTTAVVIAGGFIVITLWVHLTGGAP
jgi:succinate dehydrogenase / fumarate reductase cytochrome b subunit